MSSNTSTRGEKPDLVRAAQALEEELARLEDLSRSVRKIRLHSDKAIARAAKEMNDALAMPERIAAQLGELAQAMQSMQQRQQAALEPLAAFAAEVQARMNRLGEHMKAFAELGRMAGEVTVLLQATADGANTNFSDVEPHLTAITDGARALFEAARADDFPDVAREAEALKQRIGSLRGRLRPKTMTN